MVYDSDYFERGNELGISCYSNYRWIPELTIPMAHTIVKHLEIKEEDAILDFGCAKGYLVYALRLLHYKAWGYDISDYALQNSQLEIRQFLSNEWPTKKFDWLIAKDVLEHVDYYDIDELLSKMRVVANKIFCIIPLGNGSKYNVPYYDLDQTHKIRENTSWWVERFTAVGFNSIEYTLKVNNLKENYSMYHDGNMFLKAL